MIDLKRGTNQGPFLALFQGDLLIAFCDFDAEIVEMIMKHFFDHASHWLSYTNVSLSVHAEVALYSEETIKTCPLLPPSVDVRTILLVHY